MRISSCLPLATPHGTKEAASGAGAGTRMRSSRLFHTICVKKVDTSPLIVYNFEDISRTEQGFGYTFVVTKVTV